MVILLLLAAFLPVQQAFACDMMGGKAKAECCCHDQMAENECSSGGCEHGAQAPLGENGCCQVSLSEPAVYTSQQFVNHAIGVSELVEPPQPPPFTALSNPQTEHQLFATSLPVPDQLNQLTGLQTYLLTQRLRI